MVLYHARCILPLAARLGEGPLWLPEQQRLLFMDIKQNRLHAFTPADGSHQQWDFPDYACWIAARKDGDGFMLGLRRDVARVWLEPNLRLVSLGLDLDLPPDVRLNDAKVAPDGSLWFGSMNNVDVHRPDGRLFRLGTDGQLAVRESGVHICNGPAFSLDGKRMFHNDSLLGRTYVYEDGPARLWRQAEDGSPDGMAVDSEGAVWIAYWGAGKLLRHGPDGEVLASVILPVSQPTSLAFGGPDLRTMYITSAADELSAAQLAQQPLAGGLFAVRVDVPGLPAARYG